MYAAVVVKTNTSVYFKMLAEVIVCSLKLAIIIGSGNMSTVCRGTAAVSGIAGAGSIINAGGNGVHFMQRQNNCAFCWWLFHLEGSHDRL